MTTVTVKIVSQLTGDLEFTSPQTLVASRLALPSSSSRFALTSMRCTSCANTGSSTNEPGCYTTAAAPVARAPRRDIGLKKRYAAERRFRAYGVAALAFGLIFLFVLLWPWFPKVIPPFNRR